MNVQNQTLNYLIIYLAQIYPGTLFVFAFQVTFLTFKKHIFIIKKNISRIYSNYII